MLIHTSLDLHSFSQSFKNHARKREKPGSVNAINVHFHLPLGQVGFCNLQNSDNLIESTMNINSSYSECP